MPPRISRRALIAGATAFAVRADSGVDRLGIMCQLQPDETSARKVLQDARKAGFRRVQITFPWDHTGAEFLKGLPRWAAAENLKVDALGAYVNCAAPETVIMSTRAQDFDRAVDFAPEIGASRLVAWTGGFGRDLMAPDARNGQPAASDAILRFLDHKMKRIEDGRLIVALESYITLVCPDAKSLRKLLDRLPVFITAVLDPPNLIPIDRYPARDAELRQMFKVLEGHIGVVHMKDFRLAADLKSYELPGPLRGVMNYDLFVQLVRRLPPQIPAIAEHIGPDQFAATRRELSALFGRQLN